MIDNPLHSPIESSVIDVGGGRCEFILHQLVTLVACYGVGYQHAHLVQDALRLQTSFAMSAGNSPTAQQLAAYEILYWRLVHALEAIAGGDNVLAEQVEGLLSFVRKEGQGHDQKTDIAGKAS